MHVKIIDKLTGQGKRKINKHITKGNELTVEGSQPDTNFRLSPSTLVVLDMPLISGTDHILLAKNYLISITQDRNEQNLT